MKSHSDLSWLSEYEELMFGQHHSIASMAKASIIKVKHMPDILYKYRACKPETLDALENDYLYSTLPREFNDPFECPLYIDTSEDSHVLYQDEFNELINLLLTHPSLNKSYLQKLAEIKKAHDELCNDAIQDDIRNRFNVCCFCSEYDKNPMWAHYAHQHTGFCIGYDIKNQNTNLTHLAFPVLYRLNCQLFVQHPQRISGSICMHRLTMKSLDWQIEKEWRIFFHATHSPNREKMPQAKIVYLGSRISSEYEKKITNICKRKLQLQVEQLGNRVAGDQAA